MFCIGECAAVCLLQAVEVILTQDDDEVEQQEEQRRLERKSKREDDDSAEEEGGDVGSGEDDEEDGSSTLPDREKSKKQQAKNLKQKVSGCCARCCPRPDVSLSVSLTPAPGKPQGKEKTQSTRELYGGGDGRRRCRRPGVQRLSTFCLFGIRLDCDAAGQCGGLQQRFQ